MYSSRIIVLVDLIVIPRLELSALYNVINRYIFENLKYPFPMDFCRYCIIQTSSRLIPF